MRKIKCWLARTRVRYVLVMFIFCVVLVAQTLQPMADYLAGVLFKHLDTPADGEYPSTYAHFPASPIVAGIIGGKGEGLSCSIPRLARLLFKNTSDSGPVELQFRQACNMHDFCYRHGYSTYGYNQADCDYQLQEDAYRLCRAAISFNRDENLDCELRAKKVLLGVRLGGSTPFQGRGASTYFEYDPAPVRAREFLAARLLTDGTQNSGLVSQRIAIFNIKPSGTTAVTFSDQAQTRNPPNRSWTPGHVWRWGGQVWLPPNSIPAAPRLIDIEDGPTKLVWILRRRLTNTDLCVVEKDIGTLLAPQLTPANLLNELTVSRLTQATSTWRACLQAPNHRTRDVFSTSAFPIRIETAGHSPPYRTMVTAITPSLKHRDKGDWYRLAVTAENFTLSERHTQAIHLEDGHLRPADLITEDIYRFFAVPPIVGRFDATRPSKDHSREIAVFKRGVEPQGKDYRQSLTLVVTRVPDLPEARLMGREEVKAHSALPIPETLEPLTLLPGLNSPDRFISATSSNERLRFFTFSLSPIEPSGNIAPREAKMQIDQEETSIHASWIARPALVIKPSAFNDSTGAGLILSRSFVPEERRAEGHEGVRFEFAMFRAAGDGFRLASAARCDVSYELANRRLRRACETKMRAGNLNTPTIGDRLRGAQLLAGEVHGNDRNLDLVLVDPCFDSMPIVFRGTGQAAPGAAGFEAVPLDEEAAQGLKHRERGETLSRSVSCSPLPPACLRDPAFLDIDMSAAPGRNGNFTMISRECN